MPNLRRSDRKSGGESGYTLLMVVFLVATMLVLAAAVVPNLLTQGRREREEEVVWRGEQYERAIGMFYRKMGRYPTKIEDLTKQTNGVRFLRQAYTDPMNKDDGSWRLIYVGPNGQLVGSRRQISLLQSVVGGPTAPGGTAGGSSGPGLISALGALAGGNSSGGTASGGTSFGAASSGFAGPNSSGSATAGGAVAGDSNLSGSTGFGAATNPLQGQPQPLGGAVLGGNIIGVGSKVKESSLRVYQGGDKYEQWEFIWNPGQQLAIPGQGISGPAAPANPAAAPTPGASTGQDVQPATPAGPGTAPLPTSAPATGQGTAVANPSDPATPKPVN